MADHDARTRAYDFGRPDDDGDAITDEQKQILDELHLRKIDLADAVFVVDPGGYIAKSTTREIAYARSTGKPVVRLSQIDGGTGSQES